jgi:hypothetical protein
VSVRLASGWGGVGCELVLSSKQASHLAKAHAMGGGAKLRLLTMGEASIARIVEPTTLDSNKKK